MAGTSRGIYRGSEIGVGFLPRLWRSGDPLVIQVPGLNGTGDTFISDTWDDEPRAVADRGRLVYGVTSGARWGNADMDTSIDSAITYASSTWGADTDPVALIGGSMGGACVLNWARTHLASVSRIALIVPAVDIEDIRSNNRGGNAASIEAAYTNLAGWTAARPTRNPIEYAASLAAIPIRIWSSTDDPLCVPATITAFAAAHGNTTLTSLGAVGHDSSGLNADDLADWIDAA